MSVIRSACRLMGIGALVLAWPVSGAVAQESHHHNTPSVSGMPQGVPFFCANAPAVSARSGAWSDPATWSTGQVPAASARVAVAAGHDVVYDVVSDAKLSCIEVRGHLAFATDRSTRLRVTTVMVLEGGHFEVGRPDAPVAADAIAEIEIADQPIDTALDPAQIGNGIVGLGRVTMHGAVKSPTFA
jgi:hypothetical protein